MKKVLELLERFWRQLLDTIKEFPVTLIAIVLTALTSAIMFYSQESNEYIGGLGFGVGDIAVNDFWFKVFVLLFLFAVGELFVEEVFKKAKIKYIIGSIVAFCIAGLVVYLTLINKVQFLGLNLELIKETTIKIAIVYAVGVVGYSIFHMFRRTEENFEDYASKSLIEIAKASIIYCILANGLILIFIIFSILIFDTQLFPLRVELFLYGGIFIPMCLKAISRKNKKPGRFTKICILFALIPVLLMTYLIIYIYIIKIFVTNTVPSNVVFYILSALFIIGVPIWTMAHTVYEKMGVPKKLLEFLPYTFVPFIFLQCWSISVRISSYGVTPGRYLALTLIAFEIIYFVLYIIHQIGNKKAISLTIFAVLVLCVIGLLVPGISYDDVVIKSQIPRVKKMMKVEKKSDKLEGSIKSAYESVESVGYKGKEILKKEFTLLEREQIEEYEDYYFDDEEYDDKENAEEDTEVDIYGTADVDFDISKYNHIYKAEVSNYGYNCDKKVKIERLDNSDITYKIDLSNLIDWTIKNYTIKNADDYSIEGRNVYPIDRNKDFVIEDFTLFYDSKTKQIYEIAAEGYVFEK